DGMRPAVRKRDDANHRRRRDFPRFVPAVGHQVEREARQGPFPPGSRRPAGGLYRSGKTVGHPDGKRAARGLRAGAGEELVGARHPEVRAVFGEPRRMERRNTTSPFEARASPEHLRVTFRILDWEYESARYRYAEIRHSPF